MDKNEVANKVVSTGAGVVSGVGGFKLMQLVLTAEKVAPMFVRPPLLLPIVTGFCVAGVAFYVCEYFRCGEQLSKVVEKNFEMSGTEKNIAIIAIPSSEQELSSALNSESQITQDIAQKLLEKRVLVAACSGNEWNEQTRLLQSNSDAEEFSVYLVKFQDDDAGKHFGRKSNIMLMSDALKSLEGIRVEISEACPLSNLLSGIYYKI